MKLYVGNIPYEMDEEGLRSTFASFGEVSEASIVTFRQSGLSRGFGFVTMPDESEAGQAIATLNGSELGGRIIKVNEAFPQTPERHEWHGERSDRPFHHKHRRNFGKKRWHRHDRGGDYDEHQDRRW